MMGRVRRRWWVAALTLVLVVGGTTVWLVRRDDGDAVRRITATVQRGTYKTTVSADGTITPKRDAELSFSSSGVVTAVLVGVGDQVRKGDVLARIDSTVLVAQRTAAESAVTAGESAVAADGGESSAQRAANSAALAAARARLDEARQAVEGAVLVAPFTGTVSAVGVEVGQRVGGSAGGAGGSAGMASAANSSSGSTGVIAVISPKRLLVEATVPAADVGQLQRGMQAEITPAGGAGSGSGSASGVSYGVVTSVGVIASASSTGAATFPVTVEVTGKPTGLYAGASASVAITVKQAGDVLTVPTQAVRGSGEDAYVYVVDGDERTRTTIGIGATYGAQTEVTSGLEEGDVVELASFRRPSGGTIDRNGRGGLPGGDFPGNGFSGGRVPGGGAPGSGGMPSFSIGGGQ